MDWLHQPHFVSIAVAIVGCFFLTGLVSFFLRDRKPKVEVPQETEEELGIDGRPKTKPIQDKRGLARRKGKVIEVFIATPETKEEPIRGLVLDRSMNGLGLAVDYELPVGKVLSVVPVEADPMVPWVDVQVRNCRHNGTHWDVGCQFVTVPPYSTLLLFG
jgi:hypothetical protein